MSKASRISLRDVAEAAGVSTGAVSYALNGRPGVSEPVRARIIDAARELGYTGNPHARSLRTGRSGLMGLIIRDLRNPYFLDVVAGAQERATEDGITMLTIDADSSAEREREHIRRLAGQHADGLAICPAGDGSSIELWEQLRPGTPLVVLNATLPRTHGLVQVSADRRTAVRLAVGHLAELGHRRLAFLELSPSVLADRERTEIFLELAGNVGVEPRVVETGVAIEEVRDEMYRLLAGDDRPSAVVANSDFSAHAVYDVARQLGLRIGGDLSVVGQDDLPTSRLLDPPLTTIRLDRRNIGRAIAERLLQPDELGHHYEPVELCVRASTGPAPAPPESSGPPRIGASA